MKSIALFAFGLMVCLTAVGGCARKDEDDIPPPTPIGSIGKTKPPERKALPVEAYDGVIKGKVVLVGGMPEIVSLKAQMDKHVDGQVCLQGDESEKRKPAWSIGPGGAVENAVIYLKAPPGMYFNLPEKMRQRSDVVTMDQPHCAFLPHVEVTFPQFYDGKKLQPTNQRFIMKNSAPISHNTNYKGEPGGTGSGNVMLKSNDTLEFKTLAPQSSFVQIGCDIHPWMRAYVWAFDHPFAARTDKNGEFKIENVPTGVEVFLVAWHEEAGVFNGDRKGTPIKLTKGEVKQIDLKLNAK